MHDLGLAAWFGGSLMGAVGLNGAAAKAKQPQERVRLASIGWARLAPVHLAALGAHAIGGLGRIAANKDRLKFQGEARTNTKAKTVLTLGAAGVTLYSALVGARMAKHADVGAAGTTEPGAGTSDELASAQKQQKALQWALPALTAVLVILAAQQGEQQRPIAGWVDRFRS